MKTKNPILIFILVLLLVSCSNKQKREQALKDLYTKQQQHTDAKLEVDNLEVQLNNMLGDLEVAKNNINRAEEFHLFRTADTREADIKNAVESKLEVEKEIENTKEKIILLKDSVDRLSSRIASIETILKE